MGKRAEELQAAVSALLRSRRAPMSAYDIIDALQNGDRRLAPTTIYRTMAALLDNGAVHRLECRNAYVARQCDGDRRDGGEHAAVLSICDDCGMVEETLSKDVLAALSTAAGETGFAPSRHVIEVIGRCAACGSATEAAQ